MKWLNNLLKYILLSGGNLIAITALPSQTTGCSGHSQTNHDSYFIPGSVRQYADKPLCILVAWWCLQQQNGLRRSQIAEVFHNTLRRTSYRMADLRNKTRKVTCEAGRRC